MATTKKTPAEEAPEETASSAPATITLLEHQAALAAKDADAAQLSRRIEDLQGQLLEHQAALARLKPSQSPAAYKAGRFRVIGPGSVCVGSKTYPAGAVLDLGAGEAQSLGDLIAPVEG